MTGHLAALLDLLRGDPSADKVVPPSGATGYLTVIGAGAMAFLAVFALAFCLASARLAETWSTALDLTATIEIAAADRQTAEAAADRAAEVLRTTPGIADSGVLTAEDTASLLAPWMGDVDTIPDLPFPLLIEVVEAANLDREGLILRLEGEVPEARYIRHDTWRGGMAAAAGSLRSAGMISFVVSFGVMAIIVTLAARASLAINAQVVETLRLIGAQDAYIARAFVRRFTLRGLGGAAAGTAVGMLILAVLPSAAELGVAGLRPQGLFGWVLTALIPPAAGLTAFLATNRAAHRTLSRLN